MWPVPVIVHNRLCLRPSTIPISTFPKFLIISSYVPSASVYGTRIRLNLTPSYYIAIALFSVPVYHTLICLRHPQHYPGVPQYITSVPAAQNTPAINQGTDPPVQRRVGLEQSSLELQVLPAFAYLHF